jgi:glycosyltransferase involved in cell wall biosynthesis
MVSVAPTSASTSDARLSLELSDAAASKRQLRILQVFSVLSMGGAETWLMSLLKYFKEYREQLPVSVQLDILLTGGSKAIFDDEANKLGARLFYVPFTRRNMVAFVREFRRILAKGNYDAIHDHQDYVAGLHFFMGTGRLPPIRVAHVHNPRYQRARYANNLGRQAANFIGKRLLGQFATHIMGTSRQILTEYGLDGFESRGVGLGTAHCGFDVASYRGDYGSEHADLCREFGWDESARIILFVGRLEADEVLYDGQLMTHKNPAFALNVARLCMSRDQRVRLVMVGAGDTKKAEFQAQVREWELEKKIALPGVRRDLQRVMSGSDLLLFPSLAEGLGMVVVEAQAAGLRVLASSTTPLEAVVNADLVAFAPLGASAELWSDMVLRLIDLPRLDARECNELVQLSRFAIENSASHLLNIYNDRKVFY